MTKTSSTAKRLCGCVRYSSRPVSLEENALAFQTRSLRDANVQNFVSGVVRSEARRVERWDLDQLTAAAIYFDPALRIVKAQTAVVEASMTTAKTRPNPLVGFSPGYNFNAVSPVTPWIPGMTVDVPIETAGKRSKRVLQNKYNMQAAQLSLLSTVWQVRSNVQSALVQFGTAQRKLKAIEGEVEAQSALVQLLEQRVAAGAIAMTEAAPFRVARIRFLSEAAVARAASVQATNRVAEVLGVPPSAIEGVAFGDVTQRPVAISINLSELRGLALRNRSDVLELLARYEAAQAALRLEIAKQYPDVHLGSGYQWDQGENKWNLSINLEVPIFNRNRGPIAEAEARRGEAAARIFEAQARVATEIDGLAATLKSAEEESRRAAEALEELRQQTRLTRARRAAGGGDSVEMQTAIVEEQAAEIAALDAEARVALAQAQLESALQAPTEFVNSVFLAYLSLQ